MSGTTGSLLSTIALTALGWLEERRPAGPNNGPSQWLWGEHEGHATRAPVRHTAAGYGVHHWSSLFWAAWHDRYFGDGRRKSNERLLAEALITSTAALLVDYTLTPRRLRPGFDEHLSRRSIALVCVAFGVGLAVPALLRRRKRLSASRAPARRT